MKVKQIYDLVNSAKSEVLGSESILAEDLSNLVDIGTELFNANATENFVKKLVDRIGKVVVDDRSLDGYAPKVLMSDWDYGSVVEKIRIDMPDAEENASWELEDGKTYNQDEFEAPSVAVKFFDSKTTFEARMCFTDEQLKSAFVSAEEMNRFIGAIYTKINNSLILARDNLIMRTINNAIGETIYADYKGADLGSATHTKAVNLLKLYNDTFGKTLKVSEALYDVDFLKYSGLIIRNYIKRMSMPSKLFNVGGVAKFTPKELLHTVMLEDYVSAVSTYLQSDTYHDELVALPQYESVGFWQATGTDYGDNGKLSITTADNHTVKVDGKILGVLFDRDCLGVTQQNRRVTTHRNASAEFTKYWWKEDASYFNDMNENFVVFFIQDIAE